MDRILVDGVDVTDRLLSFGTKEASLRDVEVVLSDRVTVLDGTVTDRRGRPAIGATAIVFSTDPALWYAETRYVLMSGTVDGTFVEERLPPGRYFVTALEKSSSLLLEDRLDDRTFLEALVPGAARVTLEAGQRATVLLQAR